MSPGNVSPANAAALCREISVDITDGRFQKKTQSESVRGGRRVMKRGRQRKRVRCEET